ncbi:MAG: TlpA family protein disulfide reductase [Sulfuriferula sp.]
MIKKTSWLIAFIIVLSLGYSGYQFFQAPRPKTLSSDAIFHAQLPDLAGVRQPLEQWRGKVLVINFWASWCPPCQREIPGFIQLQHQYGAQGLQFIGIAIDDKAAVQAYANKTGFNYPVLVSDLEGVALARASGNYAGGLPYTLVIDRQGQVVAAGSGEMSKQELSNLITPLLQKH